MRREPQQLRSKQLVERIIAAGQAVLLERGYDATTTNHIAERASVSPGSLYQYFPDKEAILAEVIDRYVNEIITRMSRAFMSALASTTHDAVRTTVVAMLDALEDNPDLLRVFVEQLPRSRVNPRAIFARRMDDMLTTALLAQPHRPPDRSAEAMAWLVVRVAEHVTISYVLERPPIDRETVVDEPTRLITGYLEARRSPRLPS
jgi:AcrR family transcriptional regulator